jgi:MarR family 2-MHQ and catechol resistance regulon transcriptional repressor
MIHISADILARFLAHATLIKVALAKQYGLNAFQFLALVLVGGTEGLPIKQLRKKLSMPGSSLTFTLDSLENRGLIRRQNNKLDRRQWLLSLSPKGRRMYGRILKAESEAISPALDSLSDAERVTFLKLAEEIVRLGPAKRVN